MVRLYYCNHNSSLVPTSAVGIVSHATELNIAAAMINIDPVFLVSHISYLTNIILLLAVVISNSDPKHEQ